MPSPHLVVCCAAQADIPLLEALVRHLSPLVRQGRIDLWHDGHVQPGHDHEATLGHQIQEADLVILLLSPGFFASELWYRMARQALTVRGPMRVIPVLVRPMAVEQTPFATQQVLPRDGRAVQSCADQDAVWLDIVRELQALLDSLPPRDAAVSPLPPPRPHPHLQGPDSAYAPAFYVRREREERAALGYLEDAGAPAVLWGPELFGKTWLLKHLVAHLRHDDKRQVVEVNLAKLDQRARTSLDRFLKAICTRIADGCRAPRSVLDEAWDGPGDAMLSTNRLMEQLLERSSVPLVLSIDRADALADTTVQDDFFGLLRGWADDGASEPWSRLRLLVAVSATPSYLARRTDRSLFHLRAPVRLEDLDRGQARALVALHGLSWDEGDLDAVMRLVGGHPYLLRVVMYSAASDQTKLAELLRPGHLFDDYLHRLRSWLGQHPALGAMPFG